MATTPKVLFRGAATTTTSTTLYTVPANTIAVITNIIVTNTAGSAGTYTMALDDVNLATTVNVPANDSAVLDIKQVLAAGDTIKGGASATTINFHISGVEIS
jgi:hypothetical protein